MGYGFKGGPPGGWLSASVLLTDILDLLLWPLFVLVLLVLQVVLLQVDLPGQEGCLLILLQLVLWRQERVNKDPL